jgi:SAM-dependent methyltransferase
MVPMNVAKSVLNSVHNSTVFSRRIRVLSYWLSELIPAAGSVLDVGCGDGAIAQAIMARRPDLTFRGIDVFLRPQVAIPSLVYDGATIPFDTDHFDWVTIVDVLHHTDNPAAILCECARVARNGVIIKDHLRDGLLAGHTLRFMDWVGNRGHDVRLPYNYLSKVEWSALFERLSLRTAQWEQRGLKIYPFPFDLLFGRSLHFVCRIESAEATSYVRTI